MKGKGAPNLYEILKSSEAEMVRTSKIPPSRLVTKASPPAPVEPSPPVATETPSPAPGEPAQQEIIRRVTPPTPTPVQTPEESSDPGQRTVLLTVNTAVFLALIFMGLLFLAYSLGVRRGRSMVGPQMGVVSTPSNPSILPTTAPPAPVEATPQRVRSIYLMSWKAGNNRERLHGEVNAQKFKDALSRRGMKNAWFKFNEAAAPLIELYYGRYTDDERDTQRDIVKRLQKVRIRKANGSSYAPFSKCASRVISETASP